MESQANMKFHLGRIDFLRGIAITLVFMFHAHLSIFAMYQAHGYNTSGMLNADSLKKWILTLSPTGMGWIGVELFFIISGFLIHLIYLRSQQNYTWKGFFSKRFWRIYPPYVLVLTFFFIADYHTHRFGIKDFFLHLFFLHNLSDSSFFSINGPLWSVALEMQMYMIYPLFIFIRKKTGILNTVIIITSLSVLLLLAGLPSHNFGTENSYDTSLPRYWFIWGAGAYVAERFF